MPDAETKSRALPGRALNRRLGENFGRGGKRLAGTGQFLPKARAGDGAGENRLLPRDFGEGTGQLFPATHPR